MNDLRATERIMAKVRALDYLLMMRHAAKNWYMFVPYKLGITKSITITLNSGQKFRICSQKDLYNFIHRDKRWAKELVKSHKLPIRIKGKIITTKFWGKRVRFRYDSETALGTTLGLLVDLLVKKEYAKLAVRGRRVVDIGASFGDTSMYFALKGASHVYAFEPFPFAYNNAKNNIKLNGLENRITLLNAGVDKTPGSIMIDKDFVSSTASSIPKKSHNGQRVRIFTLESLVKKFKIEKAMLKIDCEGCETPIIMNAKTEVLRKFDQIVLEYQYGYRTLEKKLISAGFRVSHTKPRYFSYGGVTDPSIYIGIIFAVRI